MNGQMKKSKLKNLFRRHKVNRSFGGNVAITIVLTLFGAFTALPLYYSIINSFKPLSELWIFPPNFYVVHPTLTSYYDLFTLMSSSTVPFLRYLFNTCLITIIGAFGQVIIASMCAYPLAKHKFPGSKIYFKFIVLSLMFTSAVTAIPNYLIMAKINWIDTYQAIIVPILCSTLGIYLMKQFMEQIHDSILESARIDGANEIKILYSIVMPAVKPAWLTLTVLSVQSLWNMGASNFIYSENLKTLPYALSQIVSAGIARQGVAAAVAVIMMIVPISVFLVTQSSVIETMASSGVKE